MLTEASPTEGRNGALAWRECGAPELPVAAFFHGLGGSRFDWDEELTGLADLRRSVAWDAPGYGDSAGLVSTLPELVDTAAAWLAELGGGTPVDIVGLSFGGMLAQHLALRHPAIVATLTLVDTSPAFGFDGTTDRDEWLATRVDPMRDTGLSAEQIAAVVANLVGPDASQQVRDRAIASMRAVPAASLAASCTALVEHNTLDTLGSITAPTLVLVGEHDTETPPEYAAAIAERIPGAQLVVVPGVGHLLNLEDPAGLQARLRDHWRR